MQYCFILWQSYQQNNTVLQLPALSHSSLNNEAKSVDPRTKKAYILMQNKLGVKKYVATERKKVQRAQQFRHMG